MVEPLVVNLIVVSRLCPLAFSDTTCIFAGMRSFFKVTLKISRRTERRGSEGKGVDNA